MQEDIKKLKEELESLRQKIEALHQWQMNHEYLEYMKLHDKYSGDKKPK